MPGQILKRLKYRTSTHAALKIFEGLKYRASTHALTNIYAKNQASTRASATEVLG